MMKAQLQFLNKIVGHEMVPPDQLLANPNNWRVHSRDQKDKMKATLAEVGWLDEIIVNVNTKNMVNGHMRADIALEENESLVPVRYVDLTEAEERIALAVFDNLGALASTDRDQLATLLSQTEAKSESMEDFLASLMPPRPENYDEPLPDRDYADQDLGDEKWLILVTCKGEDEQAELLDMLEMRGVECRALSA